MPNSKKIEVEITDPGEFHCFRLRLNPSVDRCVRCGAPYGPTGACSRREQGCQGGRGENPGQRSIEVMLHATALVDLIHECSQALCQWQQATTKTLILAVTGLTEDEARKQGLIA